MLANLVPALDVAFWLFALATYAGVPLHALRVRGKAYASFSLVVLTIAFPGALVMQARLTSAAAPALEPVVAAGFAFGMAATGGHLASLARPRLRGRVFRALASIPGQAFLALGALSGVWLLLLLPLRGALLVLGLDDALGALRGLDLIPFGVAALSVGTSLRLPRELVRVPLAKDGPGPLERVPVERYRGGRRPPPSARTPLRVVQITDPHLGPWQSVRRLRTRVEELLALEPDLVCLTGDFLTMEAQGTPGALAEALAPLRGAAGRSFAVFGNHDHEAPHVVREAMSANGVTLLEDEEALVRTPAGPVQILGADWVRRERAAHLAGLFDRHPRRPGHLRLLLLHDPSAFAHVPAGEVDLVLSGHTHGGHVGLVSLGLDWTVLSRTRWPDHGLFANGGSRLYVHRGTGFYGFPLRVGVPGELSLLEIVPG